jgi:methionine-rich copper-binding protein CopC
MGDRVIRRLPLAFGLLVALLSAAVPTASAHTRMDATIPADGAVLEVSPQRVVVVFNDAIQQERSSIVVLDKDGATIAEGGLDANDPRRLVAELPPLADGGYIVRWTAYSQDNELLRDQFTFEVAAAATPAPTKAPAPTETPASTEGPTQTPTVAPSPSASAATPSPEPATPAPSLAPSPPASGGGGDGQTDPIQVLIPLVVGGVIVAAIAYFLVRRRRP